MTLKDFLAKMEYPATKDDLLREGIRSNLPQDDLQRLESLPEHSYYGSWPITSELAAAT